MSKKSVRRMNRAVIGVAGLLLITLLAACNSRSARDLFPIDIEGRTFQNPRFSPDARWLAFDQCDNSLFSKPCRSVIYDIPNDRYFAWRDANSRPITDVSFSQDGTKAVFVIETRSAFLWFGSYEYRIAVADLREGRYRFITTGPGIKRHPEFWKDGSVIFVGTEPDDTGRRKSKYLYVVEPSKTPRKLIEASFYAPSRLRPHWDGEQILMSEYGFSKRDGKSLSDSGDEILSIRPADGSITLIDIQPTPDYHTSFSGPAVARMAKKVYVETLLKKESNKPETGYRFDIFALDEKAQTKVSRLDGSRIDNHVQGSEVYVREELTARRVSWLVGFFYGMDVTDDGRQLALVTADTSRRSLRGFRLLIYDTKTHAQRELNPNQVQEHALQPQID